MFLLPLAAAILFFTGCDFQAETTPETSPDDLTIAEMEVDALKSLESTEEEISAVNIHAEALPFTPAIYLNIVF